MADILAERGFLGLCESLGAIFVVQRGFRGTDGLHELRAGAGGFRDDVPFGMAPVRRHLAATGSGVVFCADGLQQSFERGDAEHQAKRAVAIIGINPIDAGTQKQPHGGGHRFVAGAGNLEENFILALQLDFAVIQAAGKKHGAVEVDEGFAIEAVVLVGIKLGYFYARLYRHSVCPLDGVEMLAEGRPIIAKKMMEPRQRIH